MRSLFMACALFIACTPANVSNNRVMSDGKANNAITGSGNTGDAVPGNSKANAGDPNPALANFLPVAYKDDIEPLMQRLCTASCHTGTPAPGPLALNTPDALKSAVTQAITAINDRSMPQNAADLSANDQKLLAQLVVSLKNWGKNDAYATQLSDFKITYNPAINAVATGLCLSCHQGDRPSGGVSLDSQDNWKNAMPRVLKAVEAGTMPPRIDSVQGPRLLNFLKTWQAQGFP